MAKTQPHLLDVNGYWSKERTEIGTVILLALLVMVVSVVGVVSLVPRDQIATGNVTRVEPMFGTLEDAPYYRTSIQFRRDTGDMQTISHITQRPFIVEGAFVRVYYASWMPYLTKLEALAVEPPVEPTVADLHPLRGRH